MLIKRVREERKHSVNYLISQVTARQSLGCSGCLDPTFGWISCVDSTTHK